MWRRTRTTVLTPVPHRTTAWRLAVRTSDLCGEARSVSPHGGFQGDAVARQRRRSDAQGRQRDVPPARVCPGAASPLLPVVEQGRGGCVCMGCMGERRGSASSYAAPCSMRRRLPPGGERWDLRPTSDQGCGCAVSDARAARMRCSGVGCGSACHPLLCPLRHNESGFWSSRWERALSHTQAKVRKLISKYDDDDGKTRLSSEAQFLLARATVSHPLTSLQWLWARQRTASPLRCSAHTRVRTVRFACWCSPSPFPRPSATRRGDRLLFARALCAFL